MHLEDPVVVDIQSLPQAVEVQIQILGSAVAAEIRACDGEAIFRA